MADILIIGGGLVGLSTAALLAGDAHTVTLIERDPAPPPGPPTPDHADQAWDGWQRLGVNQFRLPHLMLPRWWSHVRADLPEVEPALVAAGATRLNMVEVLPASRRGPMRPDDDRFETLTARRPVLEMALSAACTGVTIRRGVSVTGLVTDQRTPVPRVTGVRTDGGALYADLVVDCSGRRSALGAWLTAAGARPPTEEREDCGFVYYGRHFLGTPPVTLTNYLQNYDSVGVLTLPGDNDTWSVVLATSARDHTLRALRDPDRWSAALKRYPLAAHWADGDPISGVDVMAGIEDRHRRLVVDGQPVATGIVVVGDAWACTNPSLGRGASIGAIHARLLRDLLRETSSDDHDKVARRFDELTARALEPLYRWTVGTDRHRLAEIDADIAGVPYRPDDQRWTISKAMFAASLRDPDVTRAYSTLAALLATPDEVVPGVLDKVVALGMDAPQYPLPGPSRAALLEAVR
jgi:2-polyprenyl-6-methoxyphenol hydroxylase-like FAD-dependent oxidoreductase